MKYIPLSHPKGLNIPILGLGTWKATVEEIENALTKALECGYRHIGTYVIIRFRNKIKNNIFFSRHCL